MDKNNFLLLSNSKYMGKKTLDILRMSANQKMIESYISNVYKRPDLALSELKENLLKHEVFLLENPLPNIDESPVFLYCKGHGVVYDHRVAIIGARNCSPYGRKIAYDLAYKLSKRGFTIVSGLALGIDGCAHQGALDAGGSTLAVLGSGVLNCYPKSHQKIYDEILIKGKIISEYGFFGKPMKHHFPFRNRLISGLSQAIIVVEARQKSGTMITVSCALSQGKAVYAVPGPIDSELSQGTHHLIAQGAQIFTNIDDFIKDIHIY